MHRFILAGFVAFNLFAATSFADDSEEGAEMDAKEKEEVTKKAEKMKQFDPQAFTCTQYLKEIEKGGEMAGVALVWAHGYMSANRGTDEMGALDADTLGNLAVEYVEHCKENPKDNFSRASLNMNKEE